MHTGVCWGNMKERDYSKDVRVDGKMKDVRVDGRIIILPSTPTSFE